MKLPAHAHGDEEGFSTYPHNLGNVGGARRMHLLVPGESWRSRCGVVTDGIIEYVGHKRCPVCVECRRIAEEA